MQMVAVCQSSKCRILAERRRIGNAAQVPHPFRPRDLSKRRPAFIPIPVGFRSENGAHRIAVEWDDGNTHHEGVYIPRRDTSSRFNHVAGGRLFPGLHHRARFTTREQDDRYFVELVSDDVETHVRVDGRVTTDWPAGSVFDSLDDASAFFEAGALGYSATHDPNTFDGLELNCDTWQCDALDVSDVYSSYFEDESRFPKGSVRFDCALLMRGIHHEWHSHRELCCAQP